MSDAATAETHGAAVMRFTGRHTRFNVMCLSRPSTNFSRARGLEQRLGLLRYHGHHAGPGCAAAFTRALECGSHDGAFAVGRLALHVTPELRKMQRLVPVSARFASCRDETAFKEAPHRTVRRLFGHAERRDQCAHIDAFMPSDHEHDAVVRPREAVGREQVIGLACHALEPEVHELESVVEVCEFLKYIRLP